MDPRSWRNNRERSRAPGRALLLFVALSFASACRSRGPDVEALAAGIRAKMKLPYDVDADTRLDDVRAVSKTTLGYFLTLKNTTKATLDPKLGKLLETNLRGNSCQNPAYVTMLKTGIGVSIAYRTADQADVVGMVITPKDCGF
jgi:hypothetical protein